jgi:hypothetical protein
MMYRVTCILVKDNEPTKSYCFRGEEIDQAIKKAKNFAEMIQCTEPTTQVNFKLEHQTWKECSFSDEFIKELLA